MRNVLAIIKNVCTFVASLDEIIESTICNFFFQLLIDNKNTRRIHLARQNATGQNQLQKITLGFSFFVFKVQSYARENEDRSRNETKKGFFSFHQNFLKIFKKQNTTSVENVHEMTGGTLYNMDSAIQSTLVMRLRGRRENQTEGGSTVMNPMQFSATTQLWK